MFPSLKTFPLNKSHYITIVFADCFLGGVVYTGECLGQWFSKNSPQTSSMSITWERVRDPNSFFLNVFLFILLGAGQRESEFQADPTWGSISHPADYDLSQKPRFRYLTNCATQCPRDVNSCLHPIQDLEPDTPGVVPSSLCFSKSSAVWLNGNVFIQTRFNKCKSWG